MKNRIFTLDKNRRLKDIIAFIQSKKCQRLLIHLHGADNKKFKKRIKKLRHAFPNAKLFATVKTNEKAKTTVAFICLDQIKDIEAVYPPDCHDKKHPYLEHEMAAFSTLLSECSDSKSSQQLHIYQQYRDAVDYAMLVSKTDKDGRITYVNENFCKKSGYTKEELLGKSHNIIRHPDMSKKVFKELWQTILKKKPWQGIIKNRRRDGTEFIVDIVIFPVLDTAGKITEFIALHKDITDQIHDHKKLKAREAELEAILNNQDAIVLFVSKSEGILSINNRFFHYFDYKDIEEFQEKHNCICDLFIEEDGYIYSKAREDWLDFVSENPDERHKVKMRDKKGKVRTFLLKANPIENSSDRFVVSLSDITPLEEALIQAKLMEHAKSMFVANMSHEIRTPLNGILGFTELLLKQPLDQTARRYLSIIHQSGETLLGIVNDILDLSKIESGKMELSPAPADLCKELEGVVAIFAAKAREKQIAYTVFIDPTIPKTIICDIQRLKQVLSNLINNAIKFTPEKGKVEVSIETLEHQDHRIKIHFEVKDSGIGIKEEQKAKIFDLFSQADNSISREYGGTGLGLPISAKFIEMMGSRIEVDSTPNKGSTFWFDLWFEIYDERYAIGELPSMKEDVKIVFYSHSSESDLIFETVQHYLKAWHIPWTSTDSCDQISEDTTFLFLLSNQEACESTQKLLERFPSLQIVLIDVTGVTATLQHPRIHTLELPIVGSALFDLLVTDLPENLTKSQTVEEHSQDHQYEGTILVAEDNGVNQILITELLHERGLHVDVVENGYEVIEAVTRQHYDLILMDVNMPKMDGIQATKELRERGYNRPIIALTANVMTEDQSVYKEAGMDDYLSKPIETDALDHILQTYLPLKEDKSQKSRLPFDDVSYEMVMDALHLKNRTLIRRLFEQFIRSAEHALNELEDILHKDDSETLKLTIHRIKGMVGNLRFNNTYTLCQTIEEALEKDHTIGTEVKENVLNLIAHLWDLREKVNRLLE